MGMVGFFRNGRRALWVLCPQRQWPCGHRLTMPRPVGRSIQISREKKLFHHAVFDHDFECFATSR
jgi:hypothetical protein